MKGLWIYATDELVEAGTTAHRISKISGLKTKVRKGFDGRWHIYLSLTNTISQEDVAVIKRNIRFTQMAIKASERCINMLPSMDWSSR